MKVDAYVTQQHNKAYREVAGLLFFTSLSSLCLMKLYFRLNGSRWYVAAIGVMTVCALVWITFKTKSDDKPIRWGDIAKLPAALFPETPEQSQSANVQAVCNSRINSLVSEHERLRQVEAQLRVEEQAQRELVKKADPLLSEAAVKLGQLVEKRKQATNNVLGVELTLYAVVRLFKELGVFDEDYDPSLLVTPAQQLVESSVDEESAMAEA